MVLDMASAFGVARCVTCGHFFFRKIQVLEDCRTLVTFEASDEERHRASMFVEEGGQDRTITTTTAS